MGLEKLVKKAQLLLKIWDILLQFFVHPVISNPFNCIHSLHFKIKSHFNKFFFKKVSKFALSTLTSFIYLNEPCFEEVVCE